MASVKLKDLLDVDVLLSLLEHPSKLNKTEYAAFEKMCRFCQDGGALTTKQKDWARDKFRALDLAATFEPVSLGEPMGREGLAELEQVMGPKVIAPPASRRHY